MTSVELNPLRFPKFTSDKHEDYMKPAGKTHKKAKKVVQAIAPVIQGCIYLLTNLANNKRYVGQHLNVKTVHRRWRRHIDIGIGTDDSRPLYRALRKAWKRDKCFKNFTAEVIWCGPVEKLHKKEIYYIKKLHTFNLDPLGDRSYNLTKGGDGVRGLKHSETTKANMSTTHLRQFEEPAARKKLSVAQLQRYKDKAEHEKTSAAIRLYWKNSAAHEKASVASRKRFEDQKERKKLSIAGKHYYEKQEAHEKSRVAALLLYENPLAHKKTSDTVKRSWEKPGRRENASAGLRRRYEDINARKKMSVSLLQACAKKTPEERSAIGFKARDTRRANKAAKAKAAKK